MEKSEKIIVLKRFENAIEANIAKTKLDANDVPCFLSDENMANLYPTQNLLAIGVSLHIFEKDLPTALEVLKENNLSINRDTDD
jgi:hypothetical protein